MLTVKASVKPSKIEGIGLFADEKIPRGTITWKFDSHFDILFDPEEVKKMPPEYQELIDKKFSLRKRGRSRIHEQCGERKEKPNACDYCKISQGGRRFGGTQRRFQEG